MNGISGFELLSKIMQGELPHAPMHDMMNMKIVEVSEGQIVYSCTPQEGHLNLQGGVHGGYYACVLDTVTGCAGQTLNLDNQLVLTLDLNTKMLRPLLANKTYQGIGSVVNRGREILITEGKIIDEDGKLYACGSAVLKKVTR